MKAYFYFETASFLLFISKEAKERSVYLQHDKSKSKSTLIKMRSEPFKKPKQNRNVAQLVAHYVRDVGVGRSSRLIPTENLTT